MARPLPAPPGVGLLVAALVVGAWVTHLGWLLFGAAAPALSEPRAWLHLAGQAWLCTGLFITAHDAMHGTVTPVRWLNHAVGAAACFLFAGFSYRMLLRNHHLHHAAPASDGDPDYLAHRPRFWPWFFAFLWRY
ncbi:MAG: fatty acid desaturase, partial [Deltaproteobacteria bacterium]|nr:fatty acid desaturase [Deltaproteobacteria bacterium]